MSHVWSWVGRHTLLLGLSSAAAALILLVGGVALGVQETPTPLSAGVGPGGGRAVPVAAQVSASRHSVSGVIVLIGRGGAWVRNANGTFFVVVLAPGAHIRANGREVPASSLRAGDRVLAIGMRTPRGALRAMYVAVTGRVVLPPDLRPRIPARPGAIPPARTATPE